MKEETFYRVVGQAAVDAVAILRQIRRNTEIIMATQDEEAALLQGIKTEFGQVLDEINAKIAELTAAVAAAGATSPAVDAATTDLKTSMDAALAQFAPPPPPTP